jgi:hypothetical protein
MANFIHIPVPEERHPTSAARASLSVKLGFTDNDEIQDWERFFADADKIESFLVQYVLGKLNEEEKFLLMDLILASTNEGSVPEGAWREIEHWLIQDFHIHHCSIWYWADIDPETGIPSNSYQIARRMQSLLVQQLERAEVLASKAGLADDSEFRNFWNTHFTDQMPVCFKLRETLRERWIRFHALPDSKRYAETEDEWSILFERNNMLANHALGDGARCWLVICRPLEVSDSDEDAHLERYDFTHAFNWSYEVSPGPAFDVPVNVAETIWISGQFDDLIRAVSMDLEGPVMFVSQETKAIYGPYDGGIDLILPDSNAVPPFRHEYRDWLPSDPGGL